MRDHDHFRRLAEFPDLIGTPEELAEFADHLRQCEACASTLLTTQAAEEGLKRLIGPECECLSADALRALKSAGFDPAAGVYTTPDEWHLLICTECRRLFEAV